LLKGGYLVVAGNPESIRRFPASATAGAEPAGNGEVPLLRLSVKELANYLTDRRSTFVALGARQHQISEEKAESKLNGLLAVFLASPAAAGITGQILSADGGYMIGV